MENKLYYGAAYYPEAWSSKDAINDIKYMKLADLNVVRMGEFAWSSIEPDMDKIDLELFKSVIEELYQNGIESIFCTPTACPPIWMTYEHPERLHVNDQGVAMIHGSRQYACTNNSFFRKRSRIITEALAKNLGSLPGLIAWQTDNEMKGNVSECFCETCCNLWHEWLKEKYQTIDNLNEAWGTAVWSQRYQKFEQVPQPLPTAHAHNPSLSTAYRRFHREKICEFQDEQIAIIRKYSNAPITHNSSERHYIDHNMHFKNLDFASFDDYPDCDHPEIIIKDYDMWRNIKPGKSFWVMETSPSHNGCIFGYRRTHRRSFLTAEAVAAYALGAQGFCYWQWRQHRTGAEMPHGAIVSSWGAPAAGFEDVAAARKATLEIESFLLSSTLWKPELAITYSDIARAFFLTEPVEGINYLEQITHWYKMVLDTGIFRDIIQEDNSLDDYKILMTPFIPSITTEYLNRAEKFVSDGGTWIIGPLSGGRTSEHTAHIDAGLSSRLEELAGVETSFMFSTTGSEETGTAFGITTKLSLWSSFFETKGAKAIGTVKTGRCPGKAFITENKCGKGKIVLIGSMPSGEKGTALLQKMTLHYANKLNVIKFDVTPGTIVAPRRSACGDFIVVVNMDGLGGKIELPSSIDDNSITIKPYEYRIISLVDYSN